MTAEEHEFADAVNDRRIPRVVPDEIAVPRRVCGDFPFQSVYVDSGTHKCNSNKYGAVSVVANNGSLLGLKPREFAVLSWKANVFFVESEDGK